MVSSTIFSLVPGNRRLIGAHIIIVLAAWTLFYFLMLGIVVVDGLQSGTKFLNYISKRLFIISDMLVLLLPI